MAKRDCLLSERTAQSRLSFVLSVGAIRKHETNWQDFPVLTVISRGKALTPAPLNQHNLKQINKLQPKACPLMNQQKSASPPVSDPQRAEYSRPYGQEHQSRSVVLAKHGMVATSHPLAAQVGLDVLQAGGNAVDAAVATSAMMGLVEPMSCGIGGDLFAICWDATSGKLSGLNASGRSPAKISPTLFRFMTISFAACTRRPKRRCGQEALDNSLGGKLVSNCFQLQRKVSGARENPFSRSSAYA